MTKNWLARACSVTPLLLSAAAHADDASIDVVGPSGRSSAAVFGNAYRNRADVVQVPNGNKLADYRRDQDQLTLSGIYSPSEGFSLSAALPWTSTDTAGQTGVGAALGASVMLLGNQAQPGFKLAGNVNISHSPAGYNFSSLALLPQYRLSTSLLLTSSLAWRHQSNAGSSEAVTGWLVWRALPNLSVVPEFGLTSYNNTGNANSFVATHAGLSLTQHFNTHWSAWATATFTATSRQSYSHYSYAYDNNQNAAFSLGVRHTY